MIFSLVSQLQHYRGNPPLLLPHPTGSISPLVFMRWLAFKILMTDRCRSNTVLSNTLAQFTLSSSLYFASMKVHAHNTQSCPEWHRLFSEIRAPSSDLIQRCLKIYMLACIAHCKTHECCSTVKLDGKRESTLFKRASL